MTRWPRFSGITFLMAALLCISLAGVLLAGQSSLPFGTPLTLSYYRDSSATMAVSEIADLPVDAFKNGGSNPSFSYTDDAIWVRLAWPGIVLAEPLLLEVLPSTLDSVSVYQFWPGAGWQVRQSGDRFPYDSREVAARAFVFQLSEIEHPVFIRITSSNSLFLRMVLWEAGAYHKHASMLTMVWGLYFGLTGGMLFLLLLNLRGRQGRSYLVLSVALLFNILHIAMMQGFVAFILGAPYDVMADVLPKITGILSMAAAIYALREFYLLGKAPHHMVQLYTVMTVIVASLPLAIGTLPFPLVVKIGYYLLLAAILGSCYAYIRYKQYQSITGRLLGAALLAYLGVYLTVMLGFLGVTATGMLGQELRHTVFFLFALTACLSLILEGRTFHRYELEEQKRRLSDVERGREDLGRQYQEQQVSLRYRESQFRSILQASPENISITDLDGTLTLVNRAGLLLFGYNRLEEMVGLSLLDLVAPEERVRAMEHLAGIKEGHFPGTQEYRVLRKDGTDFYIESSAEFIRNDEGEPLSVVIIGRDVTERRKIREELEQALARERKVLLDQKLFLSMVSHEFRTPLAVVDSAAVNLTAVPPRSDDELGERARQIKRAASAMSLLIENCLTMERLEQGGFSPIRAWVDVVQLINDASYLVHWSPRHQLELDLAGMPASWQLDSALIRVVLSNLLDNAIKYTAMGTIRVTGREELGMLVIAVEDHGEGVPFADQSALFEKYQRGQEGVALRTRGSGLGLYTSRMIVEAHGGTLILASSQPGQTVFEIRLPA